MGFEVRTGELKRLLMQNAQQIMHIPQQILTNKMKREFQHGHPTRKHWGQSVARDIHPGQTTARTVGDQVIFDAPVVFEPSAQAIYVRQQVMDKGNGQIFTNPGEQVYDEYLDQKHSSHAKTFHRVPQLEHDGQDLVDNAMTQASSMKDAMLAYAANEIMYTIFEPENVKRWLAQK